MASYAEHCSGPSDFIQFMCVKIKTSLLICAQSKVARPVLFLSCIPGQFRHRIIFSIRLRFLRVFVGFLIKPASWQIP